MKYRKFGSLEWKSSVLGLGAARLDLQRGAAAASIETIRYAIQCGINYLDLGYPYDLGRQEQVARLVGEALQDGYHQRVKIAITLPSHLIRSTADFDLYLDWQRAWLRMDCVDFCLFGRLNRETWHVLQGCEALGWAEAAMESGRIGGIGFSFHDHFQVFKRLLAAWDRWALCQFQFSYMDVDHDPGISGIKYAAEEGLAVVVTEPLKDGRLAKKPPEPIARIWGDAKARGSLAEWGLRFVWNRPEVATAICDLKSIQELAAYVSIADGMEPDSLAVQEEVLIGKVRDQYLQLQRIACSSCRPCMPCPEGIDVPRIFEIYNDAFVYEDVETARRLYRSELHHGDRCTHCRACEKRCTRKLDVIDLLEQAHQLLARLRD